METLGRCRKKFIRKSYDRMQNRVRGNRKYWSGKPLLSRQDFYKWVEGSNLDEVWDFWHRNGLRFNHIPTIDRIDGEGGYVPENMQWLTMSDNSSKAGTLGAARTNYIKKKRWFKFKIGCKIFK